MTQAQSRLINYAQAIYEATDQEMTRDDGVFVYGLGVDDPNLLYGTLKGLVDKYGADRVFDTPIAEEGMTGFGVGAAMGGMRPIHVHIRMDFLLLAMNQIVNLAAKAHYMYGGAVSVPMVIRSIIGRSWGQGAQHSQGLQAMFMHVPGLRVVAPTTPYDAKGAMVQSIRDDNPVMFVEHRLLHKQLGHVPEESYVVPIGQARTLAHGDDVTIVGISHVVFDCVRAAHALKDEGINAEVIDPLWLAPLSIHPIVESVRRTGRLLVVDSGWTSCGATSEIITRTIEELQDVRPIKVQRMGFAPVTCPTTRCLEDLFYPNATTIGQAAYQLVKGKGSTWEPTIDQAPELLEFRGPF